MIRLPDGGAALQSVLPGERDAAGWHAALSPEIAAGLSPAHATLLARPSPDGGWIADGTAAVRYGDLPEAGRRQLDAALGAILSDIRRLAERGTAPAVRAAWPALRELPDMGHVFAVDGRPVLAGWGHRVAGDAVGAGSRLARLDDGVAWRAVPARPWGLYAATLAVLALLGMAGGVLLPLLSGWFVPVPAACAIVPGQLEAMRGQVAAEGRGAELRTLLATLTEEVGRKQLQCPVPSLPAPAPVPAPRADLPQDRWDRKDVSMLEGCWTLTSGMKVTELPSGRTSPVTSWRQCFDGQGTGHQIEALEDGRRCEGPLAASFAADGQLYVSEPEPCHGTVTITQSIRLCRRTSDTEATCQGQNTSGPTAGVLYTGRFHR